GQGGGAEVGDADAGGAAVDGDAGDGRGAADADAGGRVADGGGRDGGVPQHADADAGAVQIGHIGQAGDDGPADPGRHEDAAVGELAGAAAGQADVAGVQHHLGPAAAEGPGEVEGAGVDGRRPGVVAGARQGEGAAADQGQAAVAGDGAGEGGAEAEAADGQ